MIYSVLVQHHDTFPLFGGFLPLVWDRLCVAACLPFDGLVGREPVCTYFAVPSHQNQVKNDIKVTFKRHFLDTFGTIPVLATFWNGQPPTTTSAAALVVDLDNTRQVVLQQAAPDPGERFE